MPVKLAGDTTATLDKVPISNPTCRARDSEDGLAICTVAGPSDASHVAEVRATMARSNSTGQSSQDISFSESMRGLRLHHVTVLRP